MDLPADSVHEISFWEYCFLSSKEFWYSVWLSLCQWPIFFLIIAAALSFAIGIIENGHKHGWYNGAAILFAICVITFFPSIFNFYRKILEEKKKEEEVLRHIWQGDKIHLETGDTVPADGLLITGELLVVDGVINPNIDTDQNPFLISHSVVKHGNGDMIVVSDGKKSLIQDATPRLSLLQSRVNKVNETTGMIVLVLYDIILVVVLERIVRKVHEKDYGIKPINKGNVSMNVMENVLQRIFIQFRWNLSFLGITLLTVILGLQHGMPLSIYISLSLWVKRIKSHGGKFQNLSACGTMGLVSVICMDVTGGGWLTYEHIEIEQFWVGEKMFISGMELHPDIVKGLEQAIGDLRFCLDNSVQYLRETLFRFWFDLGLLDIHDSTQSQEHIGELMRNSENSSYFGDDALPTLKMCSHYYDNSGRIHDINNNRRHLFEQVIIDMIDKGLRPIAFVCVDTNHHQHVGGGLKLLGFVGLKYSFDQNIKRALDDLKDYGIRIVLTSEDELSVATAMVVNLNLQCGVNLYHMIEGVEFRKKMEGTENERNELMNSITVMGKAAPEDKLLLLQQLKADGHVVAFMGGLTTSDAPTMREADVGIALENWTSEASRTISDLVIANPVSLIKIIKCGRCIYFNVQKFYVAQFTSTISGLLLILGCSMISGNSPLSVVHLLLLSFIMYLLGTPLMLIKFDYTEVESAAVVGERDRSLITKLIMIKMAIHLLYQPFLFLLLEYVGLKVFLPNAKENVRHTIIFNTFILWQICNLVGAMGLVTTREKVLKAVLQSPLFLILLASVLTVQVIVVEFDAKIVNGVKLSAGHWAICFLLAALRLAMEPLL